MSTAIFLSETEPVNSYWILRVHQWFWASCQQPHFSETSMCCRHILAYIVTPLPNITKVLFKKKKTEKNPLCTGSRKQSQRSNLWACDFARCKYCTGLQPSSSITAQIFPSLVLNVLVFVNSTMVYFLWGICIITSTAMCLKVNSEDVIFGVLNVLKFPLVL